MKKLKNLFINLILPGIILSGLIGAIIGFILFFYKYLWDLIFHNSLKIYEKISSNLILIIPAILVIVTFAFVQTYTTS